MAETSIVVTVRSGLYGQDMKSFAIPISEHLMRELHEPVELSNEPFSLMLASFKTISAVEIREQKFQMRRETARKIARMIEDMLVEEFGSNDQTDGYSKKQMASFR